MVSTFSTTSKPRRFSNSDAEFFLIFARGLQIRQVVHTIPKTGDICGIVAQRPRLKGDGGFTSPRYFLGKNIVYLQRGRSGKIGTAQRGSVAAIPCVHALHALLRGGQIIKAGLQLFERQRVAGSDGIITAIGVGFDLARGGNKPRQLIGGMIEISGHLCGERFFRAPLGVKLLLRPLEIIV